MLCAYTRPMQISGERLQDHWSSGFKYTCKEIIKYFLKMLQILLKSREISRSRSGPFSLACTDPYTCIG